MTTAIRSKLPGHQVERILDGESALTVWREFRGLSLLRVAAASGIKPADLELFEAELAAPNKEQLMRLAGVLGTTQEDIRSDLADTANWHFGDETIDDLA